MKNISKIDRDGNKWWYKDGSVHRDDGSAIEFSNGSKYWYKESKLHRIDGHTVESFYGYKEWWIEGEKINSQEEFERIIKLNLFW